MTLKVHVLGLRNFQKVQKERHSSEMALQWVLRSLELVPKELVLQGHRSSEKVGEHYRYWKDYHHGQKNLH
jgi:hypothetical protein